MTDLERIKAAGDKVTTQETHPDGRVKRIVHSSASLGLSAEESFEDPAPEPRGPVETGRGKEK
jgi:hypothetical protein